MPILNPLHHQGTPVWLILLARVGRLSGVWQGLGQPVQIITWNMWAKGCLFLYQKSGFATRHKCCPWQAHRQTQSRKNLFYRGIGGSAWSNCCNSFFFFLVFLGLHLWHMEVPRLGVKLELQPLACITPTATPDPSHVCNLHHGSWQHQIFNPLSEVRDQIRILMDPSWVR